MQTCEFWEHVIPLLRIPDFMPGFLPFHNLYFRPDTCVTSPIFVGTLQSAGKALGLAALSSPHRQYFAGLAERMEIISTKDIQLCKFLGAGGYGEVGAPTMKLSLPTPILSAC